MSIEHSLGWWPPLLAASARFQSRLSSRGSMCGIKSRVKARRFVCGSCGSLRTLGHGCISVVCVLLREQCCSPGWYVLTRVHNASDQFWRFRKLHWQVTVGTSADKSDLGSARSTCFKQLHGSHVQSPCVVHMRVCMASPLACRLSGQLLHLPAVGASRPCQHALRTAGRLHVSIERALHLQLLGDEQEQEHGMQTKGTCLEQHCKAHAALLATHLWRQFFGKLLQILFLAFNDCDARQDPVYAHLGVRMQMRVQQRFL